METAVRLGLNLTVLILRDDAYGMIRWKQANMGFCRFRPDLRQPRFREVCPKAMAQSASGSKAAITARSARHFCRDTPGVHLIDCPGRLYRERPDPEHRHQAFVEGVVRGSLCTPEGKKRFRARANSPVRVASLARASRLIYISTRVNCIGYGGISEPRKPPKKKKGFLPKKTGAGMGRNPFFSATCPSYMHEHYSAPT